MATGHGAAASHGDGDPDDGSCASAFSCDLDEVENDIKESDWQDAPRGDGNHAPRGNGNQHAQQEKSGPFPNTIGFLVARKIELLTNLQALGQEGIEGAGGDATRGSGAKWQIHGIETGSSLVLPEWTVEQAVSDYKARRPIQNPAPLSQYIFSRDTRLEKSSRLRRHSCSISKAAVAA